MDDLFTDDHPNEEQLRQQLTMKWKEKFPTADEELIKSKVDSDLYIKTLEAQKDELRMDFIKTQEELQKRANLQDMIDRLNQQGTPQAPQTPKPEEKPSIGLDEIEKLFETKLEQKKREDKELENFNKVQSKLRERFGDNASNILADQASTLGLSKDDVNTLAKKSPEAFFRMLGLDQQRQDMFQTPPRSGVRNDQFMKPPVKRTWSYYQDLKKKNPNEYWNPKTQVQMHKDGEAMGAMFFDDGDAIITNNIF